MNANSGETQRLKAAFVATVLGAAAIEGTVLAHQHHVPTGKDAFLHYQVDSTDELISALKQNPTLRANYAHHFGIKEDQVVDFVKRSLIPYRLPEGRQVTTYGVTRSGRIYPVHQYLRKGTLVWATRSGLPVLKWACANPLTKNLPGTLLSERPHPSRGLQIASRPMPLGSVSSPELPIAPVSPMSGIAAPILVPPEATASSALIPAPVLTTAAPVVIPAIASLPIPPVGGSIGHGVNLLPLIPILIGVGVATHTGGTPGGGTPGGGTPGGGTPGGGTPGGGTPGGGAPPITGGVPTAIPEPGSIMLLGIAGFPIFCGIGLRRRMAKKAAA